MPPPSRLCELDREVLELLPADAGPGVWLTASGVALLLAVRREVARDRLVWLADRGLIRDDWRRPPAFARTLAGDLALAGGSGLVDARPLRASGARRCVPWRHTMGRVA